MAMNVRETPRAVARAVEWEFAQSTYAPVLAEVPAALFPCWAQGAHREFPGIPRDASFYAQATEGLMMFFDCTSSAGRSCALPSRAADSVWHAWTRMDAAGLERFCIRHFGRSIPHLERERMADMDSALAACLVQARRRVSQPAAGLHLPRLFALDAQLGMPGGTGYRVIGGRLACSRLDAFGNPEDELVFPQALTPPALLQAGLISAEEYEAAAGPGQGVALDGDSGSGDGAAPCGGGPSCGGACGGGGCGSQVDPLG
jgi:hypothetical protein